MSIRIYIKYMYMKRGKEVPGKSSQKSVFF